MERRRAVRHNDVTFGPGSTSRSRDDAERGDDVSEATTVPPMDERVADDVRRLYASAPDAFVAARNALVIALRQDDRRDVAATVAALRRPSWIDGALNRIAAEEPELVTEFVQATKTARRIQQADAAGQRTASLPDALRAVRAAQRRLASAGNAALVDLGRKADLAGVTGRLGQIGADPVSLGLLAAGVLGLDDPQLADAFVDDDQPDDRIVSPEIDDEPNDEAARRLEVEEATRAAKALDREAQVAATAARRATERRDRAIAAVEAAQAAFDDAEAALERATSELAEHESRASDAERAADAATQAASDGAARLDDLLD